MVFKKKKKITHTTYCECDNVIYGNAQVYQSVLQSCSKCECLAQSTVSRKKKELGALFAFLGRGAVLKRVFNVYVLRECTTKAACRIPFVSKASDTMCNCTQSTQERAGDNKEQTKTKTVVSANFPFRVGHIGWHDQLWLGLFRRRKLQKQ